MNEDELTWMEIEKMNENFEWTWIKMNENEWTWMNMNENEWKWIKMNKDEWKWIKMNEHEWSWMKMNENEWTWMKRNEHEWKWMKINDHEWTWMKINENEWRWMNMNEHEWKWMKMNEHEWKWMNLIKNEWRWMNMNENPPAPKVLGRDRPDGTRKRLQVYLGGGPIFRPKPPVFDRSWRSPSKNTVKNSTEDTCSWTRPSKIGKRKVKKPRVFQLFDLNFLVCNIFFLRFRRWPGPEADFWVFGPVFGLIFVVLW